MRCQHAHCPLILRAHTPHSRPYCQAINLVRSLQSQACHTGSQGQEANRMVRKLPRYTRPQSRPFRVSAA
jgi:hypothetical protein